jgi:simple sugar transport system ATP-binding protein
MMIGRELTFESQRSEAVKGDLVLEVEELSVIGDRGRESVKGVSFGVRGGEIFGIGGVSGNGQSELVESIVGLRKVRKGRITFMGKDITNKPPREISELGVAYIPEDRMKFGIVQNMSIAENAVLKRYHKEPFSSRKILRYERIVEFAENLMEEFGIVAPSVHTPAKNLSGGNVQRLVAGRELSGNPKLIVASNPTHGLDISATEYIRNLLIAHRDNGSAILLVSTDLEELLELSDRVAIMFEGRFSGIFKPGEVSSEELGLMMSGGVSLEVGQKG